MEENKVKPTKGAKELVKWIQTHIETEGEDLKKPKIKLEFMEVDGTENCPSKIEFSKNVLFRKGFYKVLKGLPIILPRKMENLQDITIKCIRVRNLLFFYNFFR